MRRAEDGRIALSQPLPWNGNERLSPEVLRAFFAQLKLDPTVFGYNLAWIPPDEDASDDDEPPLK